MKESKRHTKIVAAAKSGMSTKTALKYINSQKLPSELKTARTYRTRENSFTDHWPELSAMLKSAPELQANTLLAYLIERYPENGYHGGQLRSLQRRLQEWRAESGKDKPVIFLQRLHPGRQSQSDWTNMNELQITIDGKLFPHLLFHFMLPYSCWETIMLCHSESFDSLALGFESAIWELGGVLPEHRTDNLSAATKRCGGARVFTEKWKTVLDYYKVKPSRNNPGESHENGSVEKSHDTFKCAVKQHLLLRGSRDFADQASYMLFIIKIKDRRNLARRIKVAEEVSLLRGLPDKKWRAPSIFPVRVSSSSSIHILGIPYSVPSRLIHYALKAHVYLDEIELYYGQKCLQKMPKKSKGNGIDYRHIIDSLVRKPGAFLNYQYRDSLFPRTIFRWAFDELIYLHPSNGHKSYLKILQLAKMYGEQEITTALEILRDEKAEPAVEVIKQLLDAVKLICPQVHINQPVLSDYDGLHGFTVSEVA